MTEFSATGNCFPILLEKSDCAEFTASSDPISEVTIVRSGSLSARIAAARANTAKNTAALICKTEPYEKN